MDAQTIQDLVKILKDRAPELGLAWQLRPGKVTGNSDYADSELTVTFDGPADAVNVGVPCVTLIGYVRSQTRVMVLTIPATGANYIIGYAPADTAVETTRSQSGRESITFVTQTTFTQVVTFARPFTSTPRVFTNITSGSGTTSGWSSRAIAISTTQFTMFVYGSSSSWTNIGVDWLAVMDNT